MYFILSKVTKLSISLEFYRGTLKNRNKICRLCNLYQGMIIFMII